MKYIKTFEKNILKVGNYAYAIRDEFRNLTFPTRESTYLESHVGKIIEINSKFTPSK